jgi:hypothetical protein
MCIDALDASPPRIQIADDIARELRRAGDLHLHDGFQQHGLAPGQAGLDRHGTRYLEGQFRRIDLVIAAVERGHDSVHDRVARGTAGLDRFSRAGLDGGDVFPGNDSTLDGVHELEAATAFGRLQLQPDVAVLTAAARLPNEPTLGLDRTRDSLAVRHARLAHIDPDTELAGHAP